LTALSESFISSIPGADLRRGVYHQYSTASGDALNGLSNLVSPDVIAHPSIRPDAQLQVGGQVKMISEGIPDATTGWMAFDIGTQFNTGLYGLVIGGAIQNVGGQASANGALITRLITTEDGSQLAEQRRVQFFTRETELPVEFRISVGSDLLGSANSLFGGAKGNNKLNAELSVTDATDISTQYALGLEYGYRNLLFVRGGKRFYNDERDTGDVGQVGLAGGFGLRLPIRGRAVRFDYSYEAAGALQNIQVFSFEVGR
jgi:hypothetical protein